MNVSARRWLFLLHLGWLLCLASCGQNPSSTSEDVADTADSLVASNDAGTPASQAGDGVKEGDQDGVKEDDDQTPEEVPWDYDPYRVLVWWAADDPQVNLETLEAPVRAYLDRDFAALWQLNFANAPPSVRTAAMRDLGGLDYDLITAADPILAVKRDHPDAIRIRVAKNVGEYVKKIYATKDRIAEVKQRAIAAGDETMDGVEPALEAVEGDAISVRELWAKPETEALLIARGMATTLTEPEAKLITPSIANLVGEVVEQYDKVFVAKLKTDVMPFEVHVVEFDTLMRHFGPVAVTHASSMSRMHIAVGQGLTKAFAPVVRIENAGQRSAVGLLRAGGLILERDRNTSPAAIRLGDVLEPMTRKNDRNGDPIVIGPLDWAYLHVTDLTGYEGRNIEMDYYAGRAGGLQGRKNKRTFRTALKVRPVAESTLLRLHLQRDPDFPLIGYELYEKDLESSDMTFVGRTDWNGRLMVDRTEDPLRLLYVKNGGAVLARLPVVPGLYPKVVADLSGDDIRLQAEAYVRGVQNAIVDLVAIRKLFEARIRLRLERGEMKKAEELLTALREQPSSEKLYDEIGKKHTEFINLLGSKSANQSRKVDEMFTTTRELLAKNITPQLVRELEADMIAAEKNGGRLPPPKEAPEAAEEPEATEGEPTSDSVSTEAAESEAPAES
jgi:hypothetical protein